MYKYLIRPLLFLFNPESVHYFVTGILRFICNIPGFKALLKAVYQVNDPSLEREIFGLSFKNPVGLAAGFDKDAKLVDCMDALGFGFVEVGTLTPMPQTGNVKPRLFRLIKDKALINRMGFNNRGVQDAVKRLSHRDMQIIVGGNIGKNKDTPIEQAVRDYEHCFETLYDHVDYFVVNVSSPNTPNLRELQGKEPLKHLLSRINDRNKDKKDRKPVLLKIAPDLTEGQLNDIVELVKEMELDGIIATNTTIERSNLNTESEKVSSVGEGGLSGLPLRRRSTEVIRYLRQNIGEDITIIGVGGIFSPKDALEKLEAGANLLQIYTGFIYEGPALVRKINKAIIRHLRRHG